MSGEIDILVIPADGIVRVEQIDPTLANFQALVGGYIQAVPLIGGHEGTLYCNEEGKLSAHLRNEVATRFAYIMRPDYIAGDAFVTGPYDDDGNDTSVDERLLEWVASAMGVRPQTFRASVR